MTSRRFLAYALAFGAVLALTFLAGLAIGRGQGAVPGTVPAEERLDVDAR